MHCKCHSIFCDILPDAFFKGFEFRGLHLQELWTRERSWRPWHGYCTLNKVCIQHTCCLLVFFKITHLILPSCAAELKKKEKAKRPSVKSLFGTCLPTHPLNQFLQRWSLRILATLNVLWAPYVVRPWHSEEDPFGLCAQIRLKGRRRTTRNRGRAQSSSATRTPPKEAWGNRRRSPSWPEASAQRPHESAASPSIAPCQTWRRW